ncbi:MAG: HAMP domain-containing sensor histidine kinase [Nitriliruptor sp.]|uniref:sensor histidine kinase n=1 Tax=Nitriliruptor sp. TaxID=2448056 RepID=UPI0034A079CA
MVRPLRSLRVRVPLTAILVFAVSLAVATGLAYELLLQASRNDIDVVLDRERERFETSMATLLDEEVAALEAEAARTREAAADNDPASAPDPEPVDGIVALERAARRYLQLNPATESYWTIIRTDGRAPLASSNGPDELEPLFRDDRLPQGTLGRRETISSDAGDIRSSAAPIVLGGEPVGSYQIVAPLAPVRAEALTAAGLVAASAAVSLIIGALLLSTALWRSLSPLLTLATAARAIELRRLNARVEVPETDDEVGILAHEFNSMLERLERASSGQTEFMASISHELRTPITIARGHLEMLHTIDRDDTEALRETIEVVEDELHRMGRLVEDLMAIARSEMEGFVRPRALELVAFFEDLELKVAGLRIEDIRIEPPPPVVLAADPDRLAQAVLNLVANAAVHTPDGTRIEVRAAEAPGEVVLIVSDQGPGIPASIRDEVFAPFVRAGDAPSSTGLGLAVVQAVIDAHGGHVELDTGVHGTRFELHLPHEPPPSDDAGSVGGVTTDGSHAGSAPPAVHDGTHVT